MIEVIWSEVNCKCEKITQRLIIFLYWQHLNLCSCGFVSQIKLLVRVGFFEVVKKALCNEVPGKPTKQKHKHILMCKYT